MELNWTWRTELYDPMEEGRERVVKPFDVKRFFFWELLFSRMNEKHKQWHLHEAHSESFLELIVNWLKIDWGFLSSEAMMDAINDSQGRNRSWFLNRSEKYDAIFIWRYWIVQLAAIRLKIQSISIELTLSIVEGISKIVAFSPLPTLIRPISGMWPTWHPLARGNPVTFSAIKYRLI